MQRYSEASQVKSTIHSTANEKKSNPVDFGIFSLMSQNPRMSNIVFYLFVLCNVNSITCRLFCYKMQISSL